MVKIISENKLLKMFDLYFRGYSQTDIANKLKITQPSVSIHVSKFKSQAEQQGIMATAKEYGVMNLVEELHGLATELKKDKLTVEEAKVGLNMELLLQSCDVDQDEYGDLIKTCQAMKKEGSIAAAIELTKLETGTGMSYTELVVEYKGFYDQLIQAQQELENTNESLEQSKLELVTIGKQKEQAMQDLTKHMQQLAVDMNRLTMVAPLDQALKKAGVPDEELEDYVVRQQVLHKADMSINLFTEIVEKAKVLTWHDHGKALLKALSDYAGLEGLRKDLEAKVASLKAETIDLGKVAKEKGKLLADVVSLKLDKATYEGLAAQVPAKKEELDQLKKDITSFTKQKAELEQGNAGLMSYKNQLETEIKEEEHWVADLKHMQAEHDKLVKDSADLEEKVKNDQERWAIFESFLGFVQSTSLEKQEQFAKVLPSLLEDMKNGEYSPQLLKSHVLDVLTGSALQVLTCSCGLHSTVDMPAPSWGYKCPVSGSSEFSHYIMVDKDASVILNEALAKAEPIPIQLSTIHILKTPKPKEKA